MPAISNFLLRLSACAGLAFASGLAVCSGAAVASETTLYSFQGGSDGMNPRGTPVMDNDANLYGTTAGGGSGSDCADGGPGCGTVFKIAPSGAESVLYSFAGGCDGAFPENSLLADKIGNYYGTTIEGGACNDKGFGTIFKLSPGGSETVLYAFRGGNDGEVPVGELALDKKSNLYGSTTGGGNVNGCDCGTVFQLRTNGKERLLHVFQGGTDGIYPTGGVIRDSSGNLYGTTVSGGSNDNCYGDDQSCGAIFKVAPDGTETVLYSFQGGNDGFAPAGTLLMDKAGNLYGTTTGGGLGNQGVGTVFELTPAGTETVLYAFRGGNDGGDPEAGLVMDKAGNLYGTTYYGGGTGCDSHHGCGTVFKVAPNGTETVLYAFTGGSDGANPAAALLMGKKGLLYGTTLFGGTANDGVVFSVNE